MNSIARNVLVLALLCSLCPSTIFTRSFSKCPSKCICDLDKSGRYLTRCHHANLREVPTNEIDEKMEIVEIENPSHVITIGNIFTSFKKLEILRITNSGVPAIGMYSFWGVASLRILDLERNNITHINSDNFKGQEKLHELNLSGNRLGVARIPSGTFLHLTNLHTLRLEANKIEELSPRIFQSLKNLRFLDLSGNPLGSLLPDAFRDIPELKTFKCRQCSLKQIKPELFNMIPKLNELNLGSNQFKHFDNELNAMRNLRNLILDHNQIHEISNRLFSFHHKSLEHLDLSRNGLIRISDKAFHNLINLTHLDISYNKFTTDDFHSVKKLKTLKALNISGNVNLDLSQTSEVFTSLTNLQQLSIADIVSTPVDFFSYVSQLTSLNISGANLRNDSLLILNPLTKLVELDLSRNAIKGFSDELADKLVDIGNVILEKNPIICDVCKMEALHNRVNEIKWLNMPKCQYPRALQGKFINRISRDDLSVACLPIDDYVNSEPSTDDSLLLYFMHESRINVFAILLSTIFVLMILIFVVSISICSHQTAHYYTKEDGKQEDNDRILEGSLMSSTEISFKFPLSDEAICSMDEICIPPPTLMQKKT